MAALSTIQDDFSSGSINSTRWPTVYAASGGSVSVVSGELRINHNWDGTVPGWPPPDSGVWGQTGQIGSSSVYCRYKPLLTDDNGAGNAHKAWVAFAAMNQANLEGFGFLHEPNDGTNGRLLCKVFNNIDDEWWVDVGEISSYNPNGDHAWLRVRHSGTTFFWDTAPDDGTGKPGTWTQRFSYSQSGAGVSFDNMSGFLGATGACIHFRTYHWDTAFSAAIVVQAPAFDGVNSPLVASVTHATSGNLVGSGASIVGTGSIKEVHDTVGELVGPGASLSGTAVNGTIITHDTSGALVGAGAFLQGSAARAPNPNKTAAITDAFDQASIDTARWDVITIGAATGGVTVSGGKLRINQTNNAIGTGFLVRADVAKDFQGSHVFTRLVNGMIASNNQNGAEANVGVIDDTDSGYLWQQRSNGTLCPHWKVSGVPNDGPNFAYTPTTHAWLRIKEEGGTVYWQHAPSTANDPPFEHQWITDYTRTRAADGSFAINTMRVRFMTLMSFGSPGVPTGAVLWDCLNTRTEQIVTHGTTGALVASGAALAGVAAKRITHDTSGDLVGPGSTMSGAAMRRFEHTTSGALVGPGAIITADSSTSDVTRKLWVDVQDTAGAWSDEPQSADPWTPVPPESGSWGS